MLQHSLALLRRLRHRRLLRQALQAPAALAAKPPHHLLQSLAERQFDAWRDGRMPPLDSFEACLRRLHDEHPSIYVYDIDGPHVLARRKTGRAAEHPFDPVYARVYPKRLNQYGALLAEVLRTSGIRYR